MHLICISHLAFIDKVSTALFSFFFTVIENGLNGFVVMLLEKSVSFYVAYLECKQGIDNRIRNLLKSWLHLKRNSLHIAATLRDTWALLFLPTWPSAQTADSKISNLTENREFLSQLFGHLMFI